MIMNLKYNIKNLQQTREELKKNGFALIKYSHDHVHSYPYDAPWLEDTEFCKLFEIIKNNTLIDRVRCYSIYCLAYQVRDLSGEVLEVGVWRGGSAGILTTCLPKKTIFLADTFDGVVKSSEWEHYQNGVHKDTNLNLVEQFLQFSLGVNNYHVLEGVFPDQTESYIMGNQWSFVHIDVDVYLSAKGVFYSIWDSVVPGGIVVFDDYGFFTACNGIKRFIEEICFDKDKLFIHNLNGHAYIIKRY